MKSKGRNSFVEVEHKFCEVISVRKSVVRNLSRDNMKVVDTLVIDMLSSQPHREVLGTLTHELLYVWQNERDIKFSPMKCEGRCKMSYYLIYSTSNTPIANFYIKNLKESLDSIYGDGVRYVLDKYEACGWRGIFKRVIKNII